MQPCQLQGTIFWRTFHPTLDVDPTVLIILIILNKPVLTYCSGLAQAKEVLCQTRDINRHVHVAHKRPSCPVQHAERAAVCVCVVRASAGAQAAPRAAVVGLFLILEAAMRHEGHGGTPHRCG